MDMTVVWCVLLGLTFGIYCYFVNTVALKQYKRQLKLEAKHGLVHNIDDEAYYIVTQAQYINSDVGISREVIEFLNAKGYEKAENGTYELIYQEDEYTAYNAFNSHETRYPLWYIEKEHDLFMERCRKEGSFLSLK